VASVIIGVDPHKRSHTAVVLDANETIAEQLRIPANRRQIDRLLAWAAQWSQRVWAVENTNGLGRLLAGQLVRHGETVVDVPATLSARTRRLSGHSGRKTDEHDARFSRHRCCRQPPAASRGTRRLLGRARAARRPPLASGLSSAQDHLPATRAVGRTRARRRQAGSVDRLRQPSWCGHYVR
jgi:hypothetical protein